MKKFQFLTALFLISLLTPSCGLFEPEDPYKQDKEIHRFFRCKVNGKEWTIHSNDWFYGDRSTISYYSNTYSVVERRGGLDISMNNDKNENDQETIYIYIKDDLKLGENKIMKRSSTFFPFGKWKNNTVTGYFLDETYNNNLYITEMDSINSIIKGEFEFKGITKDGKDTVLVNDGEFAWKVYWYK